MAVWFGGRLGDELPNTSDVVCCRILPEKDVCVCVCVCVCVSHFSCVPLCDPMDHSPPGSSLFMGFSRQEVLEWVAMPSSRGSSQPGIELVSLMSPALAGRCPQSSPSTVITPLLHLPLAPPGKAEKDLIPPLIMCSGSENWPLSKNWRRDGDFSQWQPIPAFCSFAPDLFGYTGQAAPPRAAYDLIPRHTGLSPPEAPAGQSPQIVLLPVSHYNYSQLASDD